MIENQTDKYQDAYQKALSNIQDPTEVQKKALEYGEELEKTIKNIILFNIETTNNKHAMMNCYIKACCDKQEFADYKFVVGVKTLEEKEFLKGKFSNVDIVSQKELGYKEAAATSKIIISNKRMPYYFMARKEQIYVRLFEDSFYEDIQEYSTKENIDQRRMVTRDLLNASYIFSRDSKMTEEYLKENYQLRSIYSGEIIEMDKVDPEKFSQILEQICKNEKIENTVTCKDEKKKILIYADYRGAKWWHPMLKRILDDIDYQKYDITLVSQIVRNAAQIKVLQALNKNIRILMRSGHMNAEKEEYVKYHCMIGKYLELNNYQELRQEISRDTIQNEWYRIFGEASFDKVIVCDNMAQKQMGLWHMLILQSDIPEKYVIAYRNFESEYKMMQGNEEYANKVNNYIKNCNQYDKMYLISNEACNYVRENFDINTKLEVLKDRIPKEFAVTQKVNHCYYQNDQFFVLNQQGSGGNLTITVVKEPEKTKYNCVTNITNYSEENFEKLLSRFLEIKEEKAHAKLYLLDNIRYVSDAVYAQLDDMDLRDDVYVVCGVDLNDQYLAKFDQYLIYDYDNPEEDIYLDEARKLITICE